MEDKRKSRENSSKIFLNNGNYLTNFIECGRGKSTICYYCDELSKENEIQNKRFLKDWHDISLKESNPFDDITPISSSDKLKDEYDKWCNNRETNVENNNYFLESEVIKNNIYGDNGKSYKIGLCRYGCTLNEWIDNNQNKDSFIVNFLEIIHELLVQLEGYHNEKNNKERTHKLHLDIKEPNIYILDSYGKFNARLIDFGSTVEWDKDLPSIEDLKWSSSTIGYFHNCDLDSGNPASYAFIPDDEKEKNIYAIDLYSIAVIVENALIKKDVKFQDNYIKNKILEIINKGKKPIKKRYHTSEEFYKDIEELQNLYSSKNMTPVLVHYMNYLYIQSTEYSSSHIGGVQLEKIRNYYKQESVIDDELLPLCIDDSKKFFYDYVKELPDKHICLCGDGGAGKSTLLHKMFLEYLQNKQPQKYIFYLSAKSLDRQYSNCISYYINKTILQIIGETSFIINDEKVVLLIDGINEVDDNLNKQIFNEIKQYENTKIIIASRLNNNSDEKYGFSYFEVPSLTEEQIYQYLFGENVKVTLNEKLIQLLKKPLMLNLYKKINSNKVEEDAQYKSQNEMELIDNYFQQSIKDYLDKVNQIDESLLKSIEYELENVAFKEVMHIDDKVSIKNIKTNCKIVSVIGRTMFYINYDAKTISIEFTHDYFRDYFAARFVFREIFKKNNPQNKLKIFQSDPFEYPSSNVVELLPCVAQLFEIDKPNKPFVLKDYTDNIYSERGFCLYLLGLCIYSNKNIKEPLVCNGDEKEKLFFKMLLSSRSPFEHWYESTDIFDTNVTYVHEYEEAFDEFIYNTSLHCFVVPNCITVLGENAFSESSIHEIVFPNSLEEICEGACSRCEILEKVYIPASVKKIGLKAFTDCERLERIDVDDNNPFYYSENNCLIEREKNILLVGGKDNIIPEKVTAIDYKAFSGGKWSSSELVVPSNVQFVGGNAFAGCTNIEHIIIGQNVSEICAGVFANCSQIEKIEVDINNITFYSKKNCLIKTDDNSLVFGCKNSVIPNYVKSIKAEAFQGCIGLTNITIPSGLKKIGNCAFSYCKNLTKIYIPETVTFIGESAFSHCLSLETIEIKDKIVDLESIDIIDTGLSVLESIGNGTFYCCEKLSYIRIPSGVKTIGQHAFAYSGLNSIALPNSLKHIEKGAFIRCQELSSIDIPDGVKEIGPAAFWFCKNLNNIKLSNTLELIDDVAFRDCRRLIGMKLPNTLTCISSGAFSRCETIKNITIPENVTHIKGEAFSCCKDLESITILGNKTIIYDEAFENCKHLKKVYYQDGLELKDDMFTGCHQIKAIKHCADGDVISYINEKK